MRGEPEVIDVNEVPRRGANIPMTETVAEAAKRIPSAPVRLNGIFRHPDDWTEEEDNIIAAGLRAHLPLHVIGAKVNCERHTLSKHIRNHPDLKQLVIDMREDFVDQAEYQLDRMMQSGNPAAVMFVLERLGRERGWGPDAGANNKDEGTHITFGEISESEVKAADSVIDKIRQQNGLGGESKVFESDPVKMAEQQEQLAGMGEIPVSELPPESEQPKPVESVTPPPYERLETDPNEGVHPTVVDPEDYPEDIGQGMTGDDPFPGGEDSPFGSF